MSSPAALRCDRLVIVRVLARSMRADLIPAVRVILPVPKGPRGIFHAWDISHSFTGSRGQSIPGFRVGSCFDAHGNLNPRCVARHHVFQSFVYEPASRFWSLQAAEAGIFLALSAAAIALTVWWIRYRIA